MPRTMPHDIEAERALLGTMLISSSKQNELLSRLVEEDFYDRRHSLIFHAINNLDKKGIGVDVTTVTSYLNDHDELDKVGGVDYLMVLSESVSTIEHTSYYIKIIQEKAMLRHIIDETSSIASKAYDEVDDVKSFLAETEKTIMAATKDRTSGEFKEMDNIIKEVTSELNILASSNSKVNGIASGYKDFDKITLGLQKGSLNILAARPAMGKTAFALNIAKNVAAKSSAPVVLFSLEMDAGALAKRMIGAIGGILGDDLKTGKIIKTNNEKYYAAAEKASKLNLYIDDTGGITINDISARSRQLKSKEGELGLIIIDYLQLITGSSRSKENRHQEVGDISRQLKALARELEVPIIALSQLSRLVERRENKRPMLSDLSESGSIEQDADLVAFIYREGYYKEDKNEKDNGLSEIIVAKHRNGPTGKVDLVFEQDYSRFSDVSYVDGGNVVENKDLKI